jgi:crotonobetainyl-CoA:carnitine CoA-transferase CaiB-like acyl-CoA transferase
MGADVIKIEDRSGGDSGRYMTAIMGSKVTQNFYFENNNRGKRSLKVDLKKDRGKEIIYRLLEKYDVFVTNFREEAVKSLGMDYAALSQKNPRLVYAMGYGFGKEGPDRRRPALDLAAQARGGIWSISGEPGQPPPRIGAGMADQVGAGILAYGIMLALFTRERTGMGQEVNTSLLGSQVWLGSLSLQAYLFYGRTASPVARDKSANPLWSIYQCRDGKWICLAMLGSDPYWHEFCAAAEIEHLENDPRFKNHMARSQNAVELIKILDQQFGGRNREEWAKRFNETDLIWAPANDYAEVAGDPQIAANDYVIDYDHPIHGQVKMVGLPVRLSRTPGGVQRPAPEFGQHTEEILVELGYSWEEIENFNKDEVT